MNSSQTKLIETTKLWLTQDVYPLWYNKGIDRSSGGFIEALSFEGHGLEIPRRAMVQARQIYAFSAGARIGCCPKEMAVEAISQGVNYLVSKFSLSSGAFIYSVNPDGEPLGRHSDLYTQAFALFGLANAYALNRSPQTKDRAKELLNYLNRERRGPNGGYTELDEKGNILFRSNPHMHLFEAGIAWMQTDPDPIWLEFTKGILDLCLHKFIHPKHKILAEYFNQNWEIELEQGRFIYEPGHQYEWAWLFSLYQNLAGENLKSIHHDLFKNAEQHGVSQSRKIVYDEVWSDHTPKKQTSRFWPQCERIKAAVRLGTEVPGGEKALYAKAADESLETLFKFFETPTKGLWYDVLSEEDTFNATSAKASSLYHIVNAIEEYINLRPQLER